MLPHHAVTGKSPASRAPRHHLPQPESLRSPRNSETRDGHWLLNTVLYSAAAGIGAAVISSIGGYAFACYEFRGRRILFGAILVTVMVPVTVLVIPLYLLLADVNLLNNPWGFILPSVVSPVGIYLMRVYSQAAVPRSLLEAARVDGAGEVRIFLSIAARLISPGAATVFLFLQRYWRSGIALGSVAGT